MSQVPLSSLEFNKISRVLLLLFNRATMYDRQHPYLRQAAGELMTAITPLLSRVSPLALILNREQFYVDEEPVDPRINVNRIVTRFKHSGIQSVSFAKGLSEQDVNEFIGIFIDQTAFPDADAINAELLNRGVERLKVNHILYKKVTMDEAIVAKDRLQDMAPDPFSESGRKSKKQFLDMILESVLAEELERTVSVRRLLENPGETSSEMIRLDQQSLHTVGGVEVGDGGGGSGGIGPGSGVGTGNGAGVGDGPGGRGGGPGDGGGVGHGGAGGTGSGGGQGVGEPGTVLLYQVQALTRQVNDHLDQEGSEGLVELTDAVFEMKRQLIAGIEAQKAINVAYDNEVRILEQVNTLADDVLIRLVREEYQQGHISTTRLAAILRRLVPSADELKRLLPKIKLALLAEGMPMEDYLDLVRQLGRELQSEGLADVLKAAAEDTGIDGEALVDAIRRSPEQAAQLMTLAAEINKGTGDSSAMTDLLVEYVEKLGVTLSATEDETDGDSDHLHSVLSNVETGLVKHLRKMNMGDDVLAGLEDRLTQRIESIIDERAEQWLQSTPELEGEPAPKQSLLQTLEDHVGADTQLGGILREIKDSVESSEIDANNFEEILSELAQRSDRLRAMTGENTLPAGVLTPEAFRFALDKEISRAKRYGTAFAAMAYTVVKIKPLQKIPEGRVTQVAVMRAIYERMVQVLRTTDIVGELAKNKMAALLPMTASARADRALKRSLNQMHAAPVQISDIGLKLVIAGTVLTFEPDHFVDTEDFLRVLLRHLSEMAHRVKTIHTYG